MSDDRQPQADDVLVYDHSGEMRYPRQAVVMVLDSGTLRVDWPGVRTDFYGQWSKAVIPRGDIPEMLT